MKDGDFDVLTSNYEDVTATGATFNGGVVVNDDSQIIEKGFLCYEGSSQSYPTLVTHTAALAVDQSQSDADFSGTLSGLKPATTYSVRAYAKTEYNINYGEIVTFTTASSGSGEGFDNGGGYEWE